MFSTSINMITLLFLIIGAFTASSDCSDYNNNYRGNNDNCESYGNFFGYNKNYNYDYNYPSRPMISYDSRSFNNVFPTKTKTSKYTDNYYYQKPIKQELDNAFASAFPVSPFNKGSQENIVRGSNNLVKGKCNYVGIGSDRNMIHGYGNIII